MFLSTLIGTKALLLVLQELNKSELIMSFGSENNRDVANKITIIYVK